MRRTQVIRLALLYLKEQVYSDSYGRLDRRESSQDGSMMPKLEFRELLKTMEKMSFSCPSLLDSPCLPVNSLWSV